MEHPISETTYQSPPRERPITDNGRSGNDCDELTPIHTNSSLSARLHALHFMSHHKTGGR